MSLPDLPTAVLAFLEQCPQPDYVPSSTYRLQMSRELTFRDAARVAAYPADLGIGAVYSSRSTRRPTCGLGLTRSTVTTWSTTAL